MNRDPFRFVFCRNENQFIGDDVKCAVAVVQIDCQLTTLVSH